MAGQVDGLGAAREVVATMRRTEKDDSSSRITVFIKLQGRCLSWKKRAATSSKANLDDSAYSRQWWSVRSSKHVCSVPAADLEKPEMDS